MGAITPIGLTADEFGRGLAEGRNGIGPITQFDASGFPAKLAGEESEYSDKDIKEALSEVEEENIRLYIIQKKKRVDGRRFDEVRQITCEVGVLPRTHGSGLFTRG